MEKENNNDKSHFIGRCWHSLADVLQSRCQACNFIKKRLEHRCFPMKLTKYLHLLLQNTSTLMAASASKQFKPMKTYTESLCCRERNDKPEWYF